MRIYALKSPANGVPAATQYGILSLLLLADETELFTYIVSKDGLWTPGQHIQASIQHFGDLLSDQLLQEFDELPAKRGSKGGAASSTFRRGIFGETLRLMKEHGISEPARCFFENHFRDGSTIDEESDLVEGRHRRGASDGDRYAVYRDGLDERPLDQRELYQKCDRDHRTLSITFGTFRVEYYPQAKDVLQKKS